MADSKTSKGGADRRKVSSSQPYEVAYLKSKFPTLSGQQVAGAIRAAGPERKAITAYIKSKYDV